MSEAHLTASQQRVFDFIAGYIKQHDGSPILAEIGNACGGISRGNVHRYISQFVNMGLLTRDNRKKRGLSLTSSAVLRFSAGALDGRNPSPPEAVEGDKSSVTA